MNTQKTKVSPKSMLQLMAEEMPRDAWPSEASHAVCALDGHNDKSKNVAVFTQNGKPYKDVSDGGWSIIGTGNFWVGKENDFKMSQIPYDWQSAIVSKQDFLMAKAMTSTKEKQGMTQNKQRKQGDYIILSELSYDEKWQFIHGCGKDGAYLHPAFIYDSDEGYAIQWDYDDKLELWRSLSSLRQGDMQMDTEDVTHQYKANGGQGIGEGQYIHTMTELIQSLAEESKKDPEGYALQFEWQGEFTGNWYNSEYPRDVMAAMSDDWPVRRKAQTFDVNIEGMPKHETSDLSVSNHVVYLNLSYESMEKAEEAFYNLRGALKGNQK